MSLSKMHFLIITLAQSSYIQHHNYKVKKNMNSNPLKIIYYPYVN
jgi:hypothetical protein